VLAASYDNYIRLVLSLYIVGSMHKGSKCVFVRARNIPSVSIYFRSLPPLSPSFSGSFFRQRLRQYTWHLPDRHQFWDGLFDHRNEAVYRFSLLCR